MDGPDLYDPDRTCPLASRRKGRHRSPPKRPEAVRQRRRIYAYAYNLLPLPAATVAGQFVEGLLACGPFSGKKREKRSASRAERPPYGCGFGNIAPEAPTDCPPRRLGGAQQSPELRSLVRGPRITEMSRRGRCSRRNFAARRRIGLSTWRSRSSQAARRAWRR